MKVLVDTSVWADHFRSADPHLTVLLGNGSVVMHPFVIGELAMGNLRDRVKTTAAMASLPAVDVVPQHIWLSFVDRLALGGSGLGFVDAHLLASASDHDVKIWTRDRRLAEQASAMSVAFDA